MSNEPDGGWFAFTLGEDGNELIHDLAPGQVEIRYVGPEDVSPADLLRFAISELSAALAIVEP